MTTAVILAATVVPTMITTIAAVKAARDWAAREISPLRVGPVTSRPGIRRQGLRDSGMSRPIGLIRPQYLPALAQSRLLRLQTAHLLVGRPRR